MDNTKETVSSRHNRIAAHMKPETVAAYTRSATFKADGVPVLKGGKMVTKSQL